MSILQLTSIKQYGYIGHSAEEKILGQWFEVDLKMDIDMTKSGLSDNLVDTLDYREIISGVKNIIATNKFSWLRDYLKFWCNLSSVLSKSNPSISNSTNSIHQSRALTAK
jgi:FolB domain-containing protein